MGVAGEERRGASEHESHEVTRGPDRDGTRDNVPPVARGFPLHIMHVSSVSQIANGRLRPYPGQVRKIVAAQGWEGDPSVLFREPYGEEA